MRPILLKNFLRSNTLRGRYVFESRAVPTMLGIAHPASPTLLSNQSFRTFTTASGSTASATAPDSKRSSALKVWSVKISFAKRWNSCLQVRVYDPDYPPS